MTKDFPRDAEVSDEPVRNRSNDDRNDSGGRSMPMSGGRLMPMSGGRVVLRDDDDSCTTMGNGSSATGDIALSQFTYS